MKNIKPFVKVISGLSALMLFVIGIVNTEVIITFPGGSLLFLIAGVFLLLGLFLPHIYVKPHATIIEPSYI